MNAIKKCFIEFLARPLYTALDGIILMLSLPVVFSCWQVIIPLGLWFIVGSTIMIHKYYKVEKKEQENKQDEHSQL